MFLLEQVEVLDIVEALVQPHTDPTQLVELNKKNVKGKRILLDTIGISKSNS